MPDFSAVVRELHGSLVLAVHGELDAATVGRFDEVAQQLPARRPLVVDLSSCTFLDSSGFRSVGQLARWAARSGVTGRVVSPPDVRAVRRVVDLLGLAALVPVHDDLDDALAGEADTAS